jgi:hypothetical protein
LRAAVCTIETKCMTKLNSKHELPYAAKNLKDQ